jgi:DNA-binding SARP family transcriptional activator/tetratricopeptide (TPR) repeat protein
VTGAAAGAAFRGFGVVELHVDGVPIDLGPQVQRRVLAALMVDAGTPVGRDVLIDRIWGEAPPARARDALYTYIGRLRAVLAAAGIDEAIVRRSGGYALDVPADAVDLLRFRAAVDSAHTADELRSALALYRAPALRDVQTEWADRIAEALEQLRVTTVLRLAELARADGAAQDVVPLLVELHAAHPLDEPIAAALMGTLDATGSRAAALDVYVAMRRRLIDELGADPGPELREAQRAVLADGEAPVETPPLTRPAQLPADVRTFTGRDAELAALDAAAHEGATVAAVWGTAGVGKTTLALHWAHRVADRFPDGQLHVNLRGSDPSAPPLAAAEVLRGFLHALGVTGSAVPREESAMVGLYRSLLAGRRMLVVLDNARNSAHVRPLLPAGPGSLAVVTSRHRLTGLVAQDGAHAVAVTVLDDFDAHRLLGDRLGVARMAAEHAAAEDVINLTGRLPLALALVAARVAVEPGRSLADVATELRENRLEALSEGGPGGDVRAVFAATVRALTPEAARLFRLFGLVTSSDVSLGALAALAGEPVRIARRGVAELTAAHLLTEHTRGRYTTHDLLRAYAAELADEPDALRRLWDFYVRGASAATEQAWGTRRASTPPDPFPEVEPPAFADTEQAATWLLTERPALELAASQAYEIGADRYAVVLVQFAHPVCDLTNDQSAATRLGELGLRAAVRLKDRRAEALMHRQLSLTAMRTEAFGSATEHLNQTIALARELGDLLLEASCQVPMTEVLEPQGLFEEQLVCARRYYDLLRQAGVPEEKQGNAHITLTRAYHMLGDDHTALKHGEHAVQLADATGDSLLRAYALLNLASVYQGLGRYDDAVNHYTEASAAFRRLGSQRGEALALEWLGVNHADAGEHDAARNAWHSALVLYERLRMASDAERVRGRVADTVSVT